MVEQLRAAGILATNRAITGATWSENKAFGKFEAVVDWDVVARLMSHGCR